jgi:hypothetical protein
VLAQLNRRRPARSPPHGPPPRWAPARTWPTAR